MCLLRGRPYAIRKEDRGSASMGASWRSGHRTGNYRVRTHTGKAGSGR